MSENEDVEEFGRIYFKLNDLYQNQIKLKTDLKKFISEWSLPIDEEIYVKINENIRGTFKNMKDKAERNIEKCVVIGQTSAGKSALINAIIKSNKLPQGFGKTTKCFVMNRRSPDGRDFLLVNNKEKDIDRLYELFCETSEDCISNELSVEMFYKEWLFLNKNLVIIDTPGIDVDDEIDKDITEECKDADLVILVIDSVSAITKAMKQFLMDSKTILSKLNCVLVYNQWDRVPQGERRQTKRNHRNSALDILCRDLKADHELADRRIFFLSATNEIENIENINEDYDERFSEFRSRLQTELKEALQKRMKCLQDIHHFVKQNNNNFQYLIEKIRKEIKPVSAKLYESSKSLISLKETMKSLITSIFDEGRELFIKESLGKIDYEISSEERENYFKKLSLKKCFERFGVSENDQDELKDYEVEISSIGSSQENLIQHETLDKESGQDLSKKDISNIKKERIEIIYTKIFTECIQKLKLKIKEIIENQKTEYVNDQILVIEGLFFPLYVESSTVVMDSQFTDILCKIKSKLKLATGVTIGVSTAVGLAGLATGGVAFGILIPVEIAAGGLAGLGIGGGAVGGSLFGGTATGIIKFKKRPFHFITKNNEIPIEKAWDSYKEMINENYSNFLNKMKNGEDLAKIFNPLELEFGGIRDQTNNIQQEIRNFGARLV